MSCLEQMFDLWRGSLDSQPPAHLLVLVWPDVARLLDAAQGAPTP